MLNMSNITKEEYEYLKELDFSMTTINYLQRVQLLKIYNRIYSTNRQQTTCVDCWIEILYLIKKAYDASKHLYEKKTKNK